MLKRMRSSSKARIAVASPSSVCSLHTKPGLRSARALIAASCETNPSIRGSSRGARMRATLACARWNPSEPMKPPPPPTRYREPESGTVARDGAGPEFALVPSDDRIEGFEHPLRGRGDTNRGREGTRRTLMGVQVRSAALQDGVAVLALLEDVGYYPEPISFAK